jgi:DNA-binding XRE family transcriptional regulator
MQSEQVKKIRAELGMTTSEFARFLEVNQRTVQKWEQGESNPTGPAAALMTGILHQLEQDKRRKSSVIKFITTTAAIGGVAYLLVKLFELVTKDDK